MASLHAAQIIGTVNETGNLVWSNSSVLYRDKFKNYTDGPNRGVLGIFGVDILYLSIQSVPGTTVYLGKQEKNKNGGFDSDIDNLLNDENARFPYIIGKTGILELDLYNNTPINLIIIDLHSCLQKEDSIYPANNTCCIVDIVFKEIIEKKEVQASNG